MTDLNKQISDYTEARINKSVEDYAQIVVKNIRALRELTRTTGNRTEKTQNLILRELPPDVLTRVAVLLQEGQ